MDNDQGNRISVAMKKKDEENLRELTKIYKKRKKMRKWQSWKWERERERERESAEMKWRNEKNSMLAPKGDVQSQLKLLVNADFQMW